MRILNILIALLLTAGTGCLESVDADYQQLGLVDVSGTVRLDGAPLAGAVVIFEAPDTTFCYGRTDDSGRYTLKLNSRQSGVTPGDKIVRISTRGRTGEEAAGGEEEDPDARRPEQSDERVPARYNSLSRLQVRVSESNHSMDFDLQSGGSTID